MHPLREEDASSSSKEGHGDFHSSTTSAFSFCKQGRDGGGISVAFILGREGRGYILVGGRSRGVWWCCAGDCFQKKKFSDQGGWGREETIPGKVLVGAEDCPGSDRVSYCLEIKNVLASDSWGCRGGILGNGLIHQ